MDSKVTLGWQELHRLIGQDSEEDRPVEFTGVASLDTATETEISFLGNSRYSGKLKTTRAGLVLVPPGDFESLDGTFLVEVENPSASFSPLIEFFQPEDAGFSPGISPGAHVSNEAVLDPTEVSVAAGAVVESGARIGRGTTIGPGCVVGKQAEVGEDCLLHGNVSVRERCILGNRVILQPGVVLGSDGYGYELVDGRHQKVPQVGIVEVADDVEIGANTTIDRARFGKTYIGEGTKIDNLVQIAHNVEIGKHCLIVAQVGIAGSARIGDYVTIAAQAGVAGHLEIGDQIVIGGRGGVVKNLSEPGVYSGFPARPMSEEQRKMALANRLPKIVKEIREMKKKLEQAPSE